MLFFLRVCVYLSLFLNGAFVRTWKRCKPHFPRVNGPHGIDVEGGFIFRRARLYTKA